MKKRLTLIDGDEVVYKAGFASQHMRYYIRADEFKENANSLSSPFKTKQDAIEYLGSSEDEGAEIISELVPLEPQQTIFSMDAILNTMYAILNTIIADTECDDYRVYLTGSNNFREEVATILPYKGNRSSSDRPYYYDLIKSALVKNYSAKTIDGMEADDALSITQWHHFHNETKWETIIASQDKDLLMVPGLHYNSRTRIMKDIDKYEARFFFFKQLLTGDRTDNIPGLYRIGPVTAEKILSSQREGTYHELMDQIISTYADYEYGIDRIIEVGRLLWMLQEPGQLWDIEIDYYN